MLIFFKNKIDVLNLKQNSYSFIVKNHKIINEILKFLLKQNRIQKIPLNVCSSSFFRYSLYEKMKNFE